MILDIIKDNVVYISVNSMSKTSDYSIFKGYDDIDWYLDNESKEESMMKILLLKPVKLSSSSSTSSSIFKMIFTKKAFSSGSVIFLLKNEIVKSEDFNNLELVINIDVDRELFVDEIRIVVNTPNDVHLSTIECDGDYDVDSYKSEMRSIKIDHLNNKLLPQRFKNSDIEYMFNEWYNNIIG